MPRTRIPPTLLACQRLPHADPRLVASLGASPSHRSLGLVTCDQDDSLYIALDEVTKMAAVEVVFAKSFYAGAKHASGPYSGEVLGVLSAQEPDSIDEALWALRDFLNESVGFETWQSNSPAKESPAFLAQVVSETGHYLSKEAGIPLGAPMAYLIAPPLESTVALDAALKASSVQLLRHIVPPSETNFAGGWLGGSLADLQASALAFAEAVGSMDQSPLAALRRPGHLRNR